ncbi:MAG: metalloprotease probable rRNA maturation factor [Candidatus Peregrinibacteria bacterium GW2011_GWF2_43_17]|nr:MAG: metalloprotease probable rRNA maturation factor [Candidatus Peregrinibacteria bacterium GW2011_GWF2_43_17]KKT18710.1 MAG: putative rRNA maturation factor [Candidatus Peregrinibacteria bacterium GW2011_GWA2_43_8]HAU40399.1 rRNA maturation RNase YbeY [Candidatus Peregrinibacteria bacterium]
MQLIFSNETSTKIDKKIFESVLAKAKIGKKNISLVIVGDKRIQEINKIYRGKNKPTDVISFAYEDSPEFPKENLLGEIYISLDIAKKQSKEQSHTLKYELRFLFAHGVLHLLGYTHKTEDKLKKMLEMGAGLVE